jgi:hypothetical protein
LIFCDLSLSLERSQKCIIAAIRLNQTNVIQIQPKVDLKMLFCELVCSCIECFFVFDNFAGDVSVHCKIPEILSQNQCHPALRKNGQNMQQSVPPVEKFSTQVQKHSILPFT